MPLAIMMRIAAIGSGRSGEVEAGAAFDMARLDAVVVVSSVSSGIAQHSVVLGAA
jgi:hypothetical protein